MKRHDEIAAVLELLCETFPAFSLYEARRRPLKIGVHNDIMAALEGAITPRELGIALRFYTSNIGYLRAMRTGAERVGLDGNPAGVVTAEEAANAREKIAAKSKKIAARKQAKKATPPPVPLKRDGLAELRAAALRRRQEQSVAITETPPNRSASADAFIQAYIERRKT
jgi:sRNA-binding protein